MRGDVTHHRLPTNLQRVAAFFQGLTGFTGGFPQHRRFSIFIQQESGGIKKPPPFSDQRDNFTQQLILVENGSRSAANLSADLQLYRAFSDALLQRGAERLQRAVAGVEVTFAVMSAIERLSGVAGGQAEQHCYNTEGAEVSR